VAEAPTVTDRMFLLAAHELAAFVTDERLVTGALYPPVTALREVSRSIAIAVAREAGIVDDPESVVDAAMWWPEYVPYLPARPAERRRSTET
jgi:malic enzyme